MVGVDLYWLSLIFSLLVYFFKTFFGDFSLNFSDFFLTCFRTFFLPFLWLVICLFPHLSSIFFHIFPTIFFDLLFSKKIAPGKELKNKGPKFLDLKLTWSLLIFQAFTSLLCYNIFEKVLKPIFLYIVNCQSHKYENINV